MAKRRIESKIISFSAEVLNIDFDFVYSHEFLYGVLSKVETKACFDPCIGKGLLSRACFDNGHSCHGIELNPTRFKCAVEYIKNREAAK